MGVCTSQSSEQKVVGDPVKRSLIALKTLPRFLPRIKEGIVIDVYDGDSITVAAELAGEWFRFSVRVRGVDTPEIRTRNIQEKAAAYRARQFVVVQCLHKKVSLVDHVKEKYGRCCARVILPCGSDLAKLLVEKKLGVEYNGGTKKSFEA